jgi:hypothetical protein
MSFTVQGLQNFTVELFHKRTGRGQIGKTPSKIDFVSSNNSPSLPRLNFSRTVKIHHLAAQFDTQFISRDEKLDDIGIFPLVCDRLPAMARHRGVTVAPTPPRAL